MDENKCKILENQISQILKDFDVIIYYKGGARNEIVKLKKDIDNILNEENLSLQRFRFLRIRDNLQKKIIKNKIALSM